MKKNSKTILPGGASTSLTIMMLLLPLFNLYAQTPQAGVSKAYVVMSNCIQIKSSKPLPCPDTLSSYSVFLTDKPESIDFCFNLPENDNKQLKATLSGADKSMVMSAIPVIYGEPVTISGAKLYPARVTFALNQKPLGNVLEFSLIDSGEKNERYFTLVLHVHEKK